jgi:tetratricopeptide (TPR) repeat protein
VRHPRRRRLALVVTSFALGTTAGTAQDQAVEQECANCINNCISAAEAGDFPAAVAFAQRAIKLKPQEHFSYDLLARAQRYLGLLEAALENENRAIELFPTGKAIYHNTPDYQVAYRTRRAGLELSLGEYAKCREDLNEALKLEARDSNVLSMLGDCLANTGESDKAIAMYDQSQEVLASGHGSVNFFESIAYVRGDARRMKGDTDGARAEFAKIISSGGTGPAGTNWKAVGHSGMALLYALSEDPKVRDLKKAKESAETAWRIDSRWESVIEARAIISLLDGDAAAALPLFASARGSSRTETQLYHGIAQLRAGSRDKAIELLVRAADMNPAYRKRVETDPDLASVRTIVLSMVKELGAKSSEDRLSVKRELDTTPVTLAYIEGLGKTRRYDAALASLERFIKETRSDTLRKSAEDRLKNYRAYADLFARLVKAAKKGSLKDVELKMGAGETAATLADADAETVEIKSKGGGTAKGPWSLLAFDAYLQLLGTVAQGETDAFTIGLLCLDNDRPSQAEASFARCLAKGSKDLKAKIDEIVAWRRGIPVPSGGFVVANGRLVTADERDKLSKGLVLFRGQWVTKEDKSHLEKNHEKVDGKWVPLTEAQLEAKGFVKYGGEWKTKDEVARLKGEWTDAWALDTEHYEIRTNKSEVCLKALGTALEDAYQAYGKFFGRTPPAGKKMKVFAFAKFDDYAAYCRKLGQTERLNATGFAPSEPETLCGYDKFSDDASFMRTIVHEGCHLFYQLAFPNSRPPSWVAEGMATNFEGFTLEDGHPKWSFVSRERSGEAKEAVRRHALPSIADFLKSDAGELIARDPQRALAFYAEAWAVFYFMSHTLDRRYREGFATFLQRTSQGGKADLKDALGPAFDTLEADFSEFIRGM